MSPEEQEIAMYNEEALSAGTAPGTSQTLTETQPEDQEFTPPRRQDTEQRIGSPSPPPASSSATSLAATFVSAADQQSPQAQASVQQQPQGAEPSASTTQPPDSAVTSSRQLPEIEMKVLQRKNTA